MKPRPINTTEEQLRLHAQRQRRESPQFSADLHERIMGALRAEGLPTEEEPESQDRLRWVWRIAAPLGVAAAVAAATWTLMMKQTTITTPLEREVAREEIPALPRLGEPMRQLGSPAADALEGGKYAYLDRDAQRLMIFVADQLPTFQPPQK